MPLEATCPACTRKMRVPDHLLGRRVKCPSCQHAFQTVAEEDLPARLPAKPAKLPGYHVQAPPERRRLKDELSAAKRGRTPYDDRDDNRDYERRRSRYEDDDDEFRDEERRRNKRAKRKAKEMCLVPGIIFIVIGTLDVAMMGLTMVVGFDDLLHGQKDEGTVPAMLMLLTSIVASAVVLVGGIAMIRLRLWPLALVASIICVIPAMSPCCVLGIPFGIWGLIVLCNGRVKESFR